MIGTGDPYSFNEIVDRLNDQLNADIGPEYVENPIPEDVYVHDTCADRTIPTKRQRNSTRAPSTGAVSADERS